MVDGSTSAFLALLAACRFDVRGLVGLALVVAGLEGCLRGFGTVLAGLALADRRALEVLDILRVVRCEFPPFFENCRSEPIVMCILLKSTRFPGIE